jgi:putative RNA 2'-phosphotransferase
MNDTKISKFLSLILRHDPAAGGITLDAYGWTPVADVVKAVQSKVEPTFAETDLNRIVEESEKKRFAFSDNYIRANQGHSVEVELGLETTRPPTKLFHGTTAKAWDMIRSSRGLNKMERHAVHLSPDVATATIVGARRGKPFILVIDTDAMFVDGHDFQVSANGVWLTDEVPLKYISVLTDG